MDHDDYDPQESIRYPVTIRPAGMTAWTTATNPASALHARREALDHGLTDIVIIDRTGRNVTSRLLEWEAEGVTL